MSANPVRHNTQLHRFELDTPAGVAVADYRIAGNVMTIYHTEVPVALRRRKRPDLGIALIDLAATGG